MSVQVVANLVDESTLANQPFLQYVSHSGRYTSNIFVPSGAYGQVWSTIAPENPAFPATFIYEVTSSNGDLRFKGSLGDTGNGGGAYRYGTYARNLDKILVGRAGTRTDTFFNNIYAFTASAISAQATGFTASIGSALEQSLVSYSSSLRVNGGVGEGVHVVGFAYVPNMFAYTPSASVGYYSVFSYATSSNGDATTPLRSGTPLSASIASLSSSGQNISGAAALYPLGFLMSTLDSSTPTNELYVDLTTPLTASFNVPLNKIMNGAFSGPNLVTYNYANTYTGTYNSVLNRIYVTVGLASNEMCVVELDNNTTPPTVLSVVTSSGINSIFHSSIAYNAANEDLILLNSFLSTPSRTQYHIIDASSTLNDNRFISPKAVVTTTGWVSDSNAGNSPLAISNSYYEPAVVRNSPQRIYYLNNIQSSSAGYVVTSQSFATSYTNLNYMSPFVQMAHATASGIDKLIVSDRSDIGPIGDLNTTDENLVTTFARAGYVYSLDRTTLTTSSFFTPYTTQLNGTNASTAVTVSGSTEVGYKLNTRNLLLAYDAGSEDSFPPPPNTKIYDLSGNFNNTTLPVTVTYENISSSFFFTSSIADSAIPFTASELSTANFATFEMIVKLEGTVGGGTFRTIYGFSPYSFYQAGGAWVFSNYNGSRYIATAGGVSGDWFHIVTEMYSGSLSPETNNKIWLNGVQQSLTSNIIPADLPSFNFNNGIGRIGSPATDINIVRMHGYIPVFKIYKRILSQQEITENYNFYKSRYPIP